MIRPTVILDLGGVLVGFDFMRACSRLEAASGTPAAHIRDVILGGPDKAEFDTGRLNPKAFAARIGAAIDLSLPYSEFVDIWCDIFVEKREVTCLLDEIRSNADLILLSNTDPLHLAYVRRQYGFLGKFAHLVLSYEVGHAKPARQIYACALAACVQGSRVIYFDDVAEFVSAARALGLAAEQFVDAARLRHDLRLFGVI